MLSTKHIGNSRSTKSEFLATLVWSGLRDLVTETYFRWIFVTGNMLTDAMVMQNLRYSDGKEWNHVAISLLNSGSIRSSIAKGSERNGLLGCQGVNSLS